MRRNFLLYFFFLLSVNAFSQRAGLNYTRNLGGSQDDIFTANVLLRNGNLVSVGYTKSNDGQAQGNHGDYDCFVVCTSPNGIIVWKKVLGGTAWDAFSSDVDTTTDGNFVVGFSTASNNGDITGNHGLWDAAFFKFTPDGNPLWSKVYGSTSSEVFGSLKATPDGGIIASATTSASNSGDVTGVSHGSNDVWIIKLDINGAIQWQKLFGGTNDDRAGTEAGGAVALADDGGYFFATTTNSTDGDLNGLLPAGAVMGASDVWLCHIDAVGNILWSKLIGGSAEESPGDFYTYGNSVYFGFGTKSADRDLQGNLGLYDIALFKFNTAGVLQWKTQYASGAWDNLGDITGLKGDLLTLTGGTYSFSFAGYAMPAADERLVIFRIDTLDGSIKWMKALGGNGRSAGVAASINNNGELFVSALSTNTTGDIYSNLGGYDAVLLSYAPVNRITGTVFVDRNNNNLPDAGEDKPSYLMLKASKENELDRFTTTRNGSYNLEVDTGIYTVMPLLRNNPYYSAEPAQFTYQFISNNAQYSKNIALHAVPNVNDLTVSLTPLNVIRPGRVAQYLVTGYNMGTTTIDSGMLSFKKEPVLSFAGFSTAPDLQSANEVSWKFTSLQPFDSVKFVVSLLLPTTILRGTPMNYVLRITPVAGDSTPVNNTIYYRHIVVNSFDPNCKSNNMADSMPLASVTRGDYIYYTIQFQNTGTASAIDIAVKDTLPGNLQDSTMEVVGASHSFEFSLKNKIAAWNFFNINLPDSNTNEALSHGYIQYRIKPFPSLTTGDFIDNSAAIYFDFNPPVITDKNRVTIFIPAVIAPAAPVITPAGNVSICEPLLLTAGTGAGYQWFRNGIAIAGATGNTYMVQDTGVYTATVTINNLTSDISLPTTVSTAVVDNTVITANNDLFAVQNPGVGYTYTWQILNGAAWSDINPVVTGTSYRVIAAGDYRVKATKGLCSGFSNIQHWEPPVITASYLKVYPNPAGSFIRIDNLTGTGWETAEVINFAGQKVSPPITLKSLTELTINTETLCAGIYILILRDNKGNSKRTKFVRR